MKKTVIAFVTALFTLSLFSPAFSTTTKNDYFINLNTVKYIECVDPEGVASGTAVIIDSHRVLTAYHVIRGSVTCSIDHKPITVISTFPELDMAVLSVDLGNDPPIMRVSCDGFVRGNVYFSVGYAKAEDFAITILVGTGFFFNMKKSEEYPYNVLHLSILRGTIYHGMSGGPIVDIQGRLVGINNITMGEGVSGSRALADTPLCSALVPH